MTKPSSENARIAGKLGEAADILQAQRANPFRLRAYRRAADRVASLDVELGDVLARRGAEGLLALPGIGPGIAAAINELMRTGRWSHTAPAQVLLRCRWHSAAWNSWSARAWVIRIPSAIFLPRR